MRSTWFSVSLLAVLFALVASCGSSDDSNDPQDVTDQETSLADQVQAEDQAPGWELPGYPDVEPKDTSIPTPDNIEEPDNSVLPDQIEPDDISPDVPTVIDVTIVPEAMYTQCYTNHDCPPGYTCLTVRDNPLWGQCTIPCGAEDECPAAPHGNSVACWGQYGLCISLCGMHGGDCPEWLECIGMEFCLEQANIEATKGPGERCEESAECLGNAECISGEFTPASCFPLCASDADCAAAAPDAAGTCTNMGDVSFCMFYCGFMGGGKECPGDMECDVAVCR